MLVEYLVSLFVQAVEGDGSRYSDIFHLIFHKMTKLLHQLEREAIMSILGPLNGLVLGVVFSKYGKGRNGKHPRVVAYHLHAL